ncbi:MAG: YggS family pyridoxal phosphate-dependent enzyme [Devosia sp.]
MTGEPGAESERLETVRAAIEKATRRFGPPPKEVKLVAVSKMFPGEAIGPFLAAGQRVFGENRVQEAKAKWPALRAEYAGIELHLIGPLQTNKVKEAVELFDVIETVDREKLAAALGAEMERTGRHLPCFVEVNIGEEAQKAGIASAETVDFVRRCRELHRLNVIGLMCIPPDGVPAGPYFAHLATLGREAGLPLLSMGMSADYEVAVEMGATLVRVGSALFGNRPKAPSQQV